MKLIRALGPAVAGIAAIAFTSSSFVSAGTLARYGAFPTEWLEAVEVYPVSEAPAPVQWETWLAVRSMSAIPENEPIVIEAFGFDAAGANRLKKYFVEHHKFDPSRFVVVARSENPAWSGWTVVRPVTVALPQLPPDMKPWIALNPLFVRSAAPFPPEADKAVAVARDWGIRGPEFRFGVSTEWFSLRGPKGASDRANAEWVGPRADVGASVVSWPTGEIGADGHFFRSASGLTPDGRVSSTTEAEVSGYVLLKANTTSFGVPALRFEAGGFGNWRDGGGVTFGPSAVGPHAGMEVSTQVDGLFTAGLHGAYTYTASGLVNAGGFLAQRVYSSRSSNWDARIGADVSVLKYPVGGSTAKESWSTFLIGIAGEL